MIEFICKLKAVVFIVSVTVCDSGEEGGNKNRKMEGFIVGGNDASIDNYPHSVFLTVHCISNQDEYWICGASILNQKLLLTAAHCLFGCTGKLLIDALAGTTNIERVNVMRRVRRYVYHGKYDPVTDFCDIAVCMTYGYLPLGKLIQRVIIKRNFPPRVNGEVAGWGVINDNNAESPKLKRVIQYVKPAYECAHIRMLAGMMCVSSNSNRDYPAIGDSGSALVTRQKQQIGIVSFKSRSNRINMIVYTNVSYFYNWISLQTKRVYWDWCCGASVLNQQILITAGHCFGIYNRLEQGAKIEVYAGHENYEEAKVLRNVTTFIAHEEFDSITGHCDIGLMLVDCSLPLGTSIRRVIIRPCFPQAAAGTVYGWGVTKEHFMGPSKGLKGVEQTISSRQKCAESYAANGPLHPGMMCVTSGKNHYILSGDSGSAYVTNEHQQLGVVSISLFDHRDTPIYSNVSYFYHWIVDKSTDLHCQSSNRLV